MNPEEQADDTSIPFMDEKPLRDFLEGRSSHPGQVVFPDHLRQAMAEMNRRLARQQAKVLKAQNVLIKSQERVAKSLRLATWVLAFATTVLAGVTAWTVFAKPQIARPAAALSPATSPKSPAKSG
jgi:hypothetical protein